MTFSEAFFNIFNKLMEQFGIAIDWTAQNVVPYVQDLALRIVKYDTIKHCIWVGIGILLFFFCLRYLASKKWWEKIFDDMDEFATLIVIPLILAFATSIGIIYVNSEQIVQNTVVPEITIIEMMNDIVGGQTND